MGMIRALHHAALSCPTHELFEAEKKFYGEVLGLSVKRSFPTGIMFDTGSGIIEIFDKGEPALPQGVIRHFAFLVDSADACVATVRKAGYEVTVEPDDRVLASDPPYPIRVAFCRGPLGEEIEFFQER